MANINDPTCVCGHRRNQHSRGGGCLARDKIEGGLLPRYESCRCDDFKINKNLYTQAEMVEMIWKGKHVI